MYARAKANCSFEMCTPCEINFHTWYFRGIGYRQEYCEPPDNAALIYQRNWRSTFNLNGNKS